MSLKGIIRFHVFMILLLYVRGHSGCNLISTEPHQITAKDFKVTRYDQKYVMCSAFYCSEFPTQQPLQLLVHGMNSTVDNLVVYLEKKSVSFRNKCKVCPSDYNKTEPCISCPKIEPSKGIEIHVRLDKTPDMDSNFECNWDINFNMTVTEFMCKNGFTANIPSDDECDTSVSSNSQIGCFKPTCSEEIFVVKDFVGLYHSFPISNKSETCIWNIQIQSEKTLEINFSPDIKKFLIVYEETLLNPRWIVDKCSEDSNKLDITPTSRNVIIVYKNDEGLNSESFLSVNVSSSCPLPSTIENGEVKFFNFENGSYAHFICLENYYLMGEHWINCKDEKAGQLLPICISEKGKYMSDDPKSANETVQKSNPTLLEVNPSVAPSLRPSPKTVLDQNNTSHKEKVSSSEEPQAPRSNLSLIELDQGNVETTKTPPTDEVTSPSPVEGSGQSHSEDEDGFSDMSDTDSGPRDGSFDSDLNDMKHENGSTSRNRTFSLWPKNPDNNIVLFSLPSIEDKMMLFIIIGVGVLLIVIITIISLIVCRNRSIRNGLNRKFDTFQNPIYEKPVVRVPIPSTDIDPCQEKLDLGDMSDSTVLD